MGQSQFSVWEPDPSRRRRTTRRSWALESLEERQLLTTWSFHGVPLPGQSGGPPAGPAQVSRATVPVQTPVALGSLLDVATHPGPASAVNLDTLTFDGGPAGLQTLTVGELIRVEVLDYAVATTIPNEIAVLGTPNNPAGPAFGQRAATLEDMAINSNLNNPSVDSGILLQFVSDDGTPVPLVNRPGSDFVLFDVSPPVGTVPPSGGDPTMGLDPFRISGVLDEPGSPPDPARTAVFGADAYTFLSEDGLAADVSFFNPGPGEVIDSLAALESATLVNVQPPGAPVPALFSLNLFGAAIDLSDLGFADGEAVSQFRVQSFGDTFGVDPSFIGGIPQTPGRGPIVTSVLRAGFHAMSTQIVLTFDEQLDPTTATSTSNYTLVDSAFDGELRTLDDQFLTPVSTTYDAGAQSVTLDFGRPIGLFRPLLLMANGTLPDAIRDLGGEPLDGDRDGEPGDDFVTVLDERVLVRNGPDLSRVGLPQGPQMSNTLAQRFGALAGRGLSSRPAIRFIIANGIPDLLDGPPFGDFTEGFDDLDD